MFLVRLCPRFNRQCEEFSLAESRAKNGARSRSHFRRKSLVASHLACNARNGTSCSRIRLPQWSAPQASDGIFERQRGTSDGKGVKAGAHGSRILPASSGCANPLVAIVTCHLTPPDRTNRAAPLSDNGNRAAIQFFRGDAPFPVCFAILSYFPKVQIAFGNLHRDLKNSLATSPFILVEDLIGNENASDGCVHHVVSSGVTESAFQDFRSVFGTCAVEKFQCAVSDSWLPEFQPRDGIFSTAARSGSSLWRAETRQG